MTSKRVNTVSGADLRNSESTGGKSAESVKTDKETVTPELSTERVEKS